MEFVKAEIAKNFLMKQAILRLRIEVVIFPALIVLAVHYFAWLHVLSEIEGFLRGQILPSSCPQIFECNLSIVVGVKPCEYREYLLIVSFEAP